MNRSDFINMLEDKVPLNRQMVGEVYELIDIFPILPVRPFASA